MNKFIAKGHWWKCENLDTLSPIVDEGIALLLTDGTTEYYSYNETIPAYEKATEEEIHQFANKRGFYFIGDTVYIAKGRLKGQSKRITGEFRYTVPNTYGRVYTDYLTFDDNTKTNIANCTINGRQVIKLFDGFNVGGRL